MRLGILLFTPILLLAGVTLHAQEAVNAPEGVNEDAYGAWLFKIKPANAADVDGLLDAAVAEEFSKLGRPFPRRQGAFS